MSDTPFGTDVVDDEGFDGADDEVDGNRIDGGTAKAVLEYLAKSIVDDPEAVIVESEDPSAGSLTFRLHVAPSDMGRVIGRRGRVAQAIRTVVRAAGAKEGLETDVDIVD